MPYARNKHCFDTYYLQKMNHFDKTNRGGVDFIDSQKRFYAFLHSMIIITVLSKHRIRLYGILELKLYGIGSRNDAAVATAVGPRRASVKPANALTEARRRGRSFPKAHPTFFAYIVIDGCNFVKTVEDFYTNKGRAEPALPKAFFYFPVIKPQIKVASARL